MPRLIYGHSALELNVGCEDRLGFDPVSTNCVTLGKLIALAEISLLTYKAEIIIYFFLLL